MLEELKIENPQHTTTRPKKKTGNEDVIIKVNISMSSGIELSRDGLDYRSIKAFIEKLDGMNYLYHF